MAGGTARAEQAGGALAQIQAVGQAVAGRVQGISQAAQAMQTASENVARAITEVAAIVEQSSAAAEEMSASAERCRPRSRRSPARRPSRARRWKSWSPPSQELSQVAQDLEAAVTQFRIHRLTHGGV